MTVLKTEKLNIACSDLGPISSLPSLRSNMRDSYTAPDNFVLDESDGLFVWYGEYPGAFPYRMQDNYDRSEDIRELDACVLENDHLRAVFLPGLGAKLFSLYDKDNNKDLLFVNNVIRPCNLAARNAWTSGGIEWNFGFRGHHPYTCDKVSAAETALPDGTQVLRLYWFERARCCVVQMDAFIPEDSRVLYVRTRITNPTKAVVPVYWWTNIAVERKEGDRVIVPANGYFTAEGSKVIKRKIDLNTPFDQTYPCRGIIAKDYFWTTKDTDDHYIAQLDKDGYGLFEASTSLLKGRKLFIWGDSEGGRKWQRYLTAKGSPGSYDEIQCGIAHTQYECIPMPPHTTWEWLECLGPMQADNTKLFGDYQAAQTEVKNIIADNIGFDHLEKLLQDTHKTAVSPSNKILYRGDAFGALEQKRRELSGIETGLMNSQLDLGPAEDPETLDWLELLENGTMGEHDPEDVPPSYMYQTEWLYLLKRAVENKDSENWYTFYQLGTYLFYDGNFDEAEKCFIKSVGLSENAWSYYCLALLSEELRDPAKAAGYIEAAYRLKPNDLSLGKEYVRILQSSGHHERLIEVFDSLPQKVRTNNRCRLNLAISFARSGHVKEAEDILYSEKEGYLLVPDIREGEESMTMLWYEIQKAKGISREDAGDPPSEIDFRMQARKNER